MNRMLTQKIDFDRDEIERRKQIVRDLWSGRPVGHIPVMINVSEPAPRYSIREQMQDGDKQLEVSLISAGLTWQAIREGDTIPAMRPDVGCSCLASAFGAELFWGDDANQTCGVKPMLKDISEACKLEVPPPDAGQLGEGIERVGRFSQAGEGFISVSLLDMAGGLNVAADLLGGENLYLAMYEEPESLECLLDKIQQLFLSTIERQIESAGGEEFITTTDFPDYWFPEGRKGHVSDDISASISGEFYRRFSKLYHNMIFEKYGGGGIHNCGPNPCLAEYLEHTPPIGAIDLSYRYSSVDMEKIKRVCRKKAIIYLAEFPGPVDNVVEIYRNIMELMTPDVIVVPVLNITTDDDAIAIYRRMREISEEYAKRMDWGWE